MISKPPYAERSHVISLYPKTELKSMAQVLRTLRHITKKVLKLKFPSPALPIGFFGFDFHFIDIKRKYTYLDTTFILMGHSLQEIWAKTYFHTKTSLKPL